MLAAFLLLGIGSCLQPSSASASDRLHKAARRQPPIVTTAHHTYVDALFGIGYKDADGFLHWRRAGADPAGLLDSLQIWLLPGVPEDVKYQMLKQLDNPVIAADGMFHKGDTLGGLNSGGKIKGSKPKVYGMTIVEFDGPCLVYPPITFGNIEYTLKMGKDCGNFCYAFRIIPCPPTKTVTVTKYVEVPTPPPPPPPPPPAPKPREEIHWTELLRLAPFEYFGAPTAAGCALHPSGFLSGMYSRDQLPDLHDQPNTQNNLFSSFGLFMPLTCAKPVGLEVALRIRPYELINHNNTGSGDASLALVYDQGRTYGRLEGGARLYERQSGYYGYSHNSINPLSPPKNWVSETNGFVSGAMYADLDHHGNTIISVQGIYLHGSYVDEFSGNAELDYGSFVLYGTGKHVDTYRQNVSLGNDITVHVPDNTYWTWDARIGFRPRLGSREVICHLEPFRPWEVIAVGATYRDLVTADNFGVHQYDYHRTGFVISSTYHDKGVFGQVNARFLDGAETYNHTKQSWVDLTVGYSF